MVLLDHFHPPLTPRRHWHAFHNAWATALAWDLNTRLPPRYYAEPNVQIGIEIDVAAWDGEAPSGGRLDLGVGDWRPPAPTATLPFTITTDVIEVVIYDDSAGAVLVGAIELVSPANKDRETERDAFTAKCRGYLQEGVGLVVVDLVTTRSANLHERLVAATTFEAQRVAEADGLHATAYRATGGGAGAVGRLDVWHHPLVVGGGLPILPLWLRGAGALPVDLAASYGLTVERLRLA